MDMDLDFATQEHPVVQSTEMEDVSSSSLIAAPPPHLPSRPSASNAPSLINSVEQARPEKRPASSLGRSENDFIKRSRSAVDIAPFAPPIPPPKFKVLGYATGRTGLVYDVRMRFHYDPSEGEEAHPERPRRITEIYQELIDSGLAVDPHLDDPDSDPATQFKLARIGIREATPEEICLIHSQEHVDFVLSLEYRSKEELAQLTAAGDSIYYNKLSWSSAALAAGGAIQAARAVVAGQVRNAVAVIRPPGHHAEHGAASGFCFFNNVCVASKVVQREFPEICRRILIMDWDVHHGNGIQQAFERDPNILYISTHVFKNGGFYPFTQYGHHLECGLDEGRGKNVNIPWSEQGMTDADYMLAFQQIVMPIATEFDPDLVFIAAGFDAAEGDELGACHVSPAGFAHMTHMLMQLARGKVVACLEGGYNLRSIAKSATAMTRVLMGEPPERLGELSPTPSAVATIQKVIRTQAAFWKCMYPKDFQLKHKPELHSERLHDIIRDWQSHTLYDQYGMSELFILRETVSESYKNQVLATRSLGEARPLLILFHDPPETHGYPDLRTNRLELHNTWLTDVSKTYVEWAIKNEFAVIDVNIPKHITSVSSTGQEAYTDAENEATRANSAKELGTYLWQNYVELSNATHIFLVGVGDAYSAILDILSTQATASDDVDLTVCFVANHALRSVQKASDDDVARKFHARSMVFVSPSHAAFAPERAKKLKRRYGNVIKSTSTELQEMLAVHRDDVTARMADLTRDWREERKVVDEGVVSDEVLGD